VSRVAHDLRKHAFAVAPGTFLGSEADLVQQFEVSRPTFRQAAKILEAEQLLVVKTGIGGGFYVRQPDIAAVAHMTSVYLQSRHTTVEQVVTIFVALYAIVARAAASRRTEDMVLAGVVEFAEWDTDTATEQMDWKTYVEGQVKLVELLADLSGNPLMKLFFSITREILTPYILERVTPPNADQIAGIRVTRAKLMDAIRDGDPDMAEMLARRYVAEAGSWISFKNTLE
jgi:DNA-binding FadR family transcriptional regulator